MSTVSLLAGSGLIFLGLIVLVAVLYSGIAAAAIAACLAAVGSALAAHVSWRRNNYFLTPLWKGSAAAWSASR